MFLFVFVYLFIHFDGELVGNVLANQKRVLYLKTSLSGKAATHSNQQVINKHDSKKKKKKKKRNSLWLVFIDDENVSPMLILCKIK